MDVTRLIVAKYRRDLSVHLAHRERFKPPVFYAGRSSFPTGDRMFWIDVKPYNCEGFVCRTCGKLVIGSKLTRSEHLRRNNCAQRLNNVLKMLNADKKCLVCDGFTSDKAYGVPLCSTGKCRELYENTIHAGRKQIASALMVLR